MQKTYHISDWVDSVDFLEKMAHRTGKLNKVGSCPCKPTGCGLTYFTYAVHTIGGMCDGFSFTTACQVSLLLVSLVALASEQMFLLLQSIHFFGGLPRGWIPWMLPWRTICGYLLWCIRLTCPNYLSLLVDTQSLMASSMFRHFLIVTFLILSSLVTPIIFLRQVISNVFSLFPSILFSVHVSAPYKCMDKTSTLYSSIVVEQLMSLANQILLSLVLLCPSSPNWVICLARLLHSGEPSH